MVSRGCWVLHFSAVAMRSLSTRSSLVGARNREQLGAYKFITHKNYEINAFGVIPRSSRRSRPRSLTDRGSLRTGPRDALGAVERSMPEPGARIPCPSYICQLQFSVPKFAFPGSSSRHAARLIAGRADRLSPPFSRRRPLNCEREIFSGHQSICQLVGSVSCAQPCRSRRSGRFARMRWRCRTT